MTQPAFSAVRQALADTLTASVTNPDGSALRATANRFQQINPPMAVVMPVTGSFIRYSVTTDTETDYTLRIILLVSEGDSVSGQDLIDGYLSASGSQSVYAAIQGNSTLGGAVSFAAVTEVTGYGLMNFSGIDYLACHIIVNIGT